MYIQPLGDHRVRHPVGSQQHDLGPHHLRVRERVRAGTFLQHLPIGIRQHNHKRRATRHPAASDDTHDHGGSALPLAETDLTYTDVIPGGTTSKVMSTAATPLVVHQDREQMAVQFIHGVAFVANLRRLMGIDPRSAQHP